MNKISKISKLIRLLIIFIAVVHIAAFSISLYNGQTATNQELSLIANEESLSHSGNNNSVTTYKARAEITGSWQEFAQALENENFNSIAILASVDILFYGLIYFFVFRLFGLFQQEQIFTQRNISCIKYIGASLLVWVVVSLIYPVFVTMIIRFSGASDSLALYLSIGSTELVHLLCGLIIYTFAWVMNEALSTKQEQDLTI
ncbi:MAG: DUF2975 domain-containing protein [Colwellia sp.]|nr:DUF2975 domain-containing protein [Colwellia sp.]